MNLALFNAIFFIAHKSFLLDAVIVFFANYLPYLLVLGFLWLLFAADGRKLRTLFFGEAALAVLLSRGVVTELIHFFYIHPRPFDALGIVPLIGESGNSFPSGHAAFFFALATVIFFFSRKAGWWYYVLAILNGAARVAAGVHWPYDIMGGAIIGIASGLIVWYAFSSIYKRIQGSPPVTG